MNDQAQCQAEPEWARRRRKRRDAIRRVGFYLYCAYARTLYRPHMRLIHRLGWHWWTPVRIHPQLDHKWCQWCGERQS